MPRPDDVSQSTSLTGTSGNNLIDALFVTAESLQVPFIQRSDIDGPTIVKWGEGSGTGANLTYSFPETDAVFPNNYPDQYINDFAVLSEPLKQAHRDAFDVWSNFVNVTFTEVNETSDNVGDLRIFESKSNPNSSAEATPVAAQAFGISPGKHAGDIFYQAPYTELVSADLIIGSRGFETVLHEIAHAALSLTDISTSAGWNGAILPADLNARTYSIMSYAAVPGRVTGPDNVNENGGTFSANPTTPMVLDILATQWLFGANLNFANSDDVYKFDELTEYHKTIWDAAGTDTIDVSDHKASVFIDLTPGSYSDVGADVTASTAKGVTTIEKTLGIAYGAIIENILGGDGNDVFVGNLVNNSFTGGQGNDQISGGNGIDTSIYKGIRSNYEITNTGGVTTIKDLTGSDGVDTLTDVEFAQFSDVTVNLTTYVQPTLAGLTSFLNTSSQNESQFKAFSATYPLLGGVPSIEGFLALINANNTSNFGAGAGPVFNDETIYINIANALYQGNPTFKSIIDNSLSSATTLADKLSIVYDEIIAASARSADGKVAFQSQSEFYLAKAAELGIAGINGAALVAKAALTKIAVDSALAGIGDTINDLLNAVKAGSAEIPATSSTLIPTEVADGVAFDGNDAAAMGRMSFDAPIFGDKENDNWIYGPEESEVIIQVVGVIDESFAI